jgi:nucleoside-diphosphate-sugar epimerase
MLTKGISLFGGTGFIGSNFVKEYGHDNEIHVRERWNRRPVEGTDTLWLISTVHNYNVFEDPTLDVKTNLLTLTEGLESFKNNTPDGIFNFASSWFVYGEHGNDEVTENLGCYPQGFYSITKRCAEQLVMSFCDTFNLKYRILRYCNTVGPGDTPSAKKNALQYLIGKMQRQEDIDIYGEGRFFRNYMHVSDVCHATKLLMGNGKINNIYNVGHPDHRLFIDHIYYVRDRIGYTGNINFIAPKDFHKRVQTTSFRMNTMRLRTDTGFRPIYSLDLMLNNIS